MESEIESPAPTLPVTLGAWAAGLCSGFLTNWAHFSSGWWFWIPVAAWFVLLSGHAVWVLRRRGPS